MLVVITARHTCHTPLCFMSKKKNHSWLLHSLTLSLSFSLSLCVSPRGVITFDSRWKTGKNNSEMGEGKKNLFLPYTYTHMHMHTHTHTHRLGHWDPLQDAWHIPEQVFVKHAGWSFATTGIGENDTRDVEKEAKKQRSSVSKSPVSLHNSVAVAVESVYTSAQWLVLTLADTKSLKRHTSTLTSLNNFKCFVSIICQANFENPQKKNTDENNENARTVFSYFFNFVLINVICHV